MSMFVVEKKNNFCENKISNWSRINKKKKIIIAWNKIILKNKI